jgi:hypothetical protein
MFIFGWLLLAVLVGVFGSDRQIGFWGAFLLSLILSPLIGLIIVLFSAKEEPAKPDTKTILLESKTDPTREPSVHTSGLSVPEQLEKLLALKEKGILTEEEFQIQKGKILNG